MTSDIPSSWATGYQLPNRHESEIEEVIEDLMCSLFHMDDIEADKIKKQYLLKYPFLDKERIKNW